MRRWLTFAAATSAAVAVVALALVGLSRAATSPPPSGEARVAAIGETLRCPTCQGLSVTDSPSTIAGGMRDIIAEQVAAGKEPEEIRDYFVARYGDWILLSPRASGTGLLVWVLPLVAVAGGTALAVARRARKPSGGEADADQARAAVDAWRAGILALPDSLAGERIEAACQLLDDTESDVATGLSHPGARDAALAEVARALSAQREEASSPAVTRHARARRHPRPRSRAPAPDVSCGRAARASSGSSSPGSWRSTSRRAEPAGCRRAISGTARPTSSRR